MVTSHIDEALLESLALDTGGRYYRGTAGEDEVRQIADLVGGMPGGELGSQLRTRYEERFQFPLALGLLALLAEALIGDRRRTRGRAITYDAEAA